MKNLSPFWRSFLLGLFIVLGLVIYAYGFEVTQVNLDDFRDPSRQASRVRVTRALANPDIFEYDKEEFVVEAPIYIPCPEGGMEAEGEVDTSGPYMVITPPCTDPRTDIVVEGFNFEPDTEGPINLIPPSGVTLQLGRISTDDSGHFLTEVRVPNRPEEVPQAIRAITRRNVGLPHLTQTTYDTIDKIIETVFLALLATTVGTLIAIPVSFTAARNIMADVRSPIASVSFSIIGWLIGMGLAFFATRFIVQSATMLTENLMLNLGGVLISPLLVWGSARWAMPAEELVRPTLPKRILRVIALFIAYLAAILFIFLLGNLMVSIGKTLEDVLGFFDFLGAFVAGIGDIIVVTLPLFAALIGGGAVASFTGRFGQILSERYSLQLVRVINLVSMSLALTSIFVLIGAVLNWLYLIDNPLITVWIPVIAGVGLGVLIGVRVPPKESIPIGMSIYYISRTILNGVRSVEPLIMAIVAVIWVGIGPFAGVIALGLHTVAALGKLYSEQVESISQGPLEAVRATGATRLQTIVYAVTPQIVPPYIAFTMYRWDINVRMSTIIGFVGGGGIGFLLSQNINLLNYRAAAVQMLAIAIVVALMDYTSSYLRQKVI